MTELTVLKLQTAAREYLVYADPTNTLPLTAARLRQLRAVTAAAGQEAAGNSAPAVSDAAATVAAMPTKTLPALAPAHSPHGIIRLVHTAAYPPSRHLAQTYPEATWYLDCYHRSGEASSASAIHAAAHFLLHEKLLIQKDRRETFALASAHGVTDVLAGFVGYSVDLGRWHTGATPPLTVDNAGAARCVKIINEHTVVSCVKYDTASAAADRSAAPTVSSAAPTASSPQPNHASSPPADSGSATVSYDHSSLTVKEGVAAITVTAKAHHPDAEAAAAAALVVRSTNSNLPHHWRVTLQQPDTNGAVVGVRLFPTEAGEHVSVSAPVTVLERFTVSL